MNLLDFLNSSKLHKKKYFWLLICILITVIVLSPNLQNDFLNWDDTAYVINNDLIKDFSFNGFKNLFTTPEVVSTYVPLTLLSWAIDHAIGGLNPTIFHFFNLLLHILVVVVVFNLTKLLSKNKMVAFIVALLFGIHPMHVEVVGWISARKDLLYTLFFLGSLIAYFFYTDKESKYSKCNYYIACLILFILSLLAKGTAVILPFVLFLFDYLKERKISMKLIFEKLPFLLLSTFFVILSINMQVKGGAMDNRQFTSILDSLSVGFYGYFTYLIKAVIPFNLSVYHPYANQIGESNPWYYYTAAIPVLLLFVLLLTKFKKNRVLVFGFGFFFITLIPVIQVLPFGTAVTADRYTYLPYFGLFLLLGQFVIKLFNTYSKKKFIISLTVFYCMILSIVTFQFSKTFKNSETLWTNVLDKYPKSSLAFLNRGNYRITTGRLLDAIQDFNNGIAINSEDYSLYYNRGLVYQYINQYNIAIEDYSKAIIIKTNHVSSILNRGIVYHSMKEYKKSIVDFSNVVRLDSNNYKAYYNRAISNKSLGLYQEAIKDLNHVIVLGKVIYPALVQRAALLLLMGDKELALNDYNRATQLYPMETRALFQRGILHLNDRNYGLAENDFQTVINIDPKFVDAHINLGIVFMNKRMMENAITSFNTAENLDSSNYLIYYNRGLVQSIVKKYSLAIEEFTICLKLNPNYSQAQSERDKILLLLNKKKAIEVYSK